MRDDNVQYGDPQPNWRQEAIPGVLEANMADITVAEAKRRQRAAEERQIRSQIDGRLTELLFAVVQRFNDERPDLPEALKMQHVIELLDCDRKTAYKWHKLGMIPGDLKLTAPFRFSKREILDWVRGRNKGS